MKIGTLIYLGKEFHSGGMTIKQTRGFEHSTYDFFNGYRHSFSVMGVRLIDTVLLIWRSGACRILQTRLKVDQNGVHLGMYSTCNQERETSIPISHGWHLLAIYGQVRMIPTHEKSLPRSFHKTSQPTPNAVRYILQSFPQWFTLIIIILWFSIVYSRLSSGFSIVGYIFPYLHHIR